MITDTDKKKELLQKLYRLFSIRQRSEKEIRDYLKEKLGRDKIVGNPFSRVTYPKDIEPIMPELRSTFSVAIGLAMREM